ncbi:hypothetical protein DSM25559_1771 [Agrobacterium rosae]|uniref:Uncharacterized protein n=1 Tax=Agrobacterium rosae TaxID=1972867 RepID=A0A1R3TIC7_9HYPH|nr:hypothetical protein DSM25559_1771 [Agrobacterium rosae]
MLFGRYRTMICVSMSIEGSRKTENFIWRWWGRLTPPLSCRTSPPQVGRSNRGDLSPILKAAGSVGNTRLANLPPCGGDVRQDRGG